MCARWDAQIFLTNWRKTACCHATIDRMQAMDVKCRLQPMVLQCKVVRRHDGTYCATNTPPHAEVVLRCNTLHGYLHHSKNSRLYKSRVWCHSNQVWCKYTFAISVRWIGRSVPPRTKLDMVVVFSVIQSFSISVDTVDVVGKQAYPLKPSCEFYPVKYHVLVPIFDPRLNCNKSCSHIQRYCC